MPSAGRPTDRRAAQELIDEATLAFARHRLADHLASGLQGQVGHFGAKLSDRPDLLRLDVGGGPGAQALELFLGRRDVRVTRLLRDLLRPRQDVVRLFACLGQGRDALRLGRILAELAPTQSEVHGLVALMELQASRARARVGPRGEPILLLEQNRARWDPLLIRRGLAALQRAEQLGGASGPYALQAAIAACHARARTNEETNWARIVALYDALRQLVPSPVVELNRAVAISMAFGPAAGLELVDKLTSEPALKTYHLLPSVRGDFLKKLGRLDEARSEFERAAEMTRNERERALLLERAAECTP